MHWLANGVYVVVGILYLPILLYEMVVLGKNRRGWGQRFGRIGPMDPARRRIWVHAVSLGEMNATPRLVEMLQQREKDVDIVFSTTTDTGFARGVELYGADRVFRFPLDLSFIVERAMRAIAPSMIVLVELEVWYNLVRSAERRDVPVVVINGRFTSRSARRLSYLGPIARSMFRKLAWVGVQDETIADRFKAMGVPPNRVDVTSSLKWDTAQIHDSVEGAEELAEALGIEASRALWVCGSTGPGEETIILDAYRMLLNTSKSRPPRLAIVPRKPERFDEVARLIRAAGFECVRRSERAGEAAASSVSSSTVILGDTMGELRKFYSLASVVFVGRSLVAMGGSDPIEAAALGRPILSGPHMENFALPIESFREADAIREVHSDRTLALAVDALVAQPAEATAMGQRAQQVVRDHQGATQRTADHIVELLATCDARSVERPTEQPATS